MEYLLANNYSLFKLTRNWTNFSFSFRLPYTLQKNWRTKSCNMCCRGMYNFFIRILKSIYCGYIEYGQRGCLIGAQYLVRPNYHVCERVLWSGIFTAITSMGFALIYYYMNNFSQNAFRVIDEFQAHKQLFDYPSMGICESGSGNDKEILLKVEQTLNRSIFKDVPDIILNDKLKHVVHMLTFPNLYNSERLSDLLNYTQTLAPGQQRYLENFDYNALARNISSDCEEFFVKCSWLRNTFDCCSVFLPVTTMLGKCFLFNSLQTKDTVATEMIKELEIYREPYIMQLSFSKPAQIFILNQRDIPSRSSYNRFKIKRRSTTLTLAFQIIPTVNDDVLLDSDRHTLGCTHSDDPSFDSFYALESYSTCVTEKYYRQQLNSCQCMDLYGLEEEGSFCNLSQFKCLEEHGFFKRSSFSSYSGGCFINCKDCFYLVEDAFYSKNTEAGLQQVLSLELILLNFPISHKRRQAIRQAEDKLTAFGNILGLYMGFNVVNIIEFIYLTCCAFWKMNTTTIARG